jgi:hypothetical protein
MVSPQSSQPANASTGCGISVLSSRHRELRSAFTLRASKPATALTQRNASAAGHEPMFVGQLKEEFDVEQGRKAARIVRSCCCANQVAIKQFWPLRFREAIQSKFFVLLVPGGGVEPPRGCPRRILSLFFRVLQRVAIDRKLPHKLFIINKL